MEKNTAEPDVSGGPRLPGADRQDFLEDRRRKVRILIREFASGGVYHNF